jgi:hypothetical protein
MYDIGMKNNILKSEVWQKIRIMSFWLGSMDLNPSTLIFKLQPVP